MWRTTCTCPAGAEARRIDGEADARFAERQKGAVESDRTDDEAPSPVPPGSPKLPGEGRSSDGELPKFGRAARIYATLAVLAAAGAVVTAGVAEIVLVAVAVLLAAVAAWVTWWAALIGRIERLLRQPPRSP